MRLRRAAIVLLILLFALLAAHAAGSAAPSKGRVVLLEGHPISATPGGDDIPPAARSAAEAAVREYVARHGWYRPGPTTRASTLRLPSGYPFLPMAGRPGRDVFPRNFVDMDPKAGSILDFNCTQYTYDGHLGHDITIRGFAEKDIGVPVYAALDGRVVRTDDGHYDENGGGTPASTDANHVVIDHGGQQIAYYWHLKKGSVAVRAGDEVVAGQQIGQTASSGWSSWPHLHFETHVSGVPIEPSAGDCNPGDSGWLNQARVKTKTYLDDFAFSHVAPSADPMEQLPWDMPRTGQIALSDPALYFWFQVKSMPEKASWRAVFRRPDGTVSHEESGAFATAFSRGAWWLFGFDVEEMHRLTGTWSMELFLAGSSMGKMPIEVVAKRKRRFNRPPEPVKVKFSPRRPRAGEPLSCLVTADLLLDDPDYDVVRYAYEWSVNGEVIRSLESAAHSDVLRADALQPGDRVRCSVTPSDGRKTAPTRSRARRAR